MGLLPVNAAAAVAAGGAAAAFNDGDEVRGRAHAAAVHLLMAENGVAR